ncbi:MAG: hypothetical protein RML45_07820 [Acetobacteraceae bacterium]|nr:hypothetical protein [Acetobacteraceae bacterium]
MTAFGQPSQRPLTDLRFAEPRVAERDLARRDLVAVERQFDLEGAEANGGENR